MAEYEASENIRSAVHRFIEDTLKYQICEGASEMKKKWVEPKALVQQFMANEYVSACGDENQVYDFIWDAPRGDLYYYPNSDGKIDGAYTGQGYAKELGGYKPCQKTHEAKVTDDFFDGFVDYNYNGRQDYGEGVIVWLEYGKLGRHTYISNWHATKELNMTQWTTNKS